MATFEITNEFIEELVGNINAGNTSELDPVLEKLFPQDIAEIFDKLDLDQAVFLTDLLDEQKKVDVLTELEDDVKLRFFEGYTNNEIANTFFINLNSDDAADILNIMPPEQSKEVLRKIRDKEHSKNIASLLKFPENTAGSLMAKEIIKLKLNWTVKRCAEEIKKQTEDSEDVFYAYVVDDYDELVGLVSVKNLLVEGDLTRVKSIVQDNVIFENTYASGEEVAATMSKYDLADLPIVDAFNRLVGRITFDDVLDYVKDEAEKDFQMLSGISSDVESDDTVFKNIRARLPWLVVGLLGGIASSLVIGNFEEELLKNVQLALFLPLIMAMAGNVGVQSSSIIVQGLANNSIDNSGIWKQVNKELLIGLLNGLVCSTLLMGYGFLSGNAHDIMLTVSVALISVILLAAVVGTSVPLILDRLKIDPAMATGPFITTSNDLLGIFLYFMIGNWLLV